MIRKRQQIKSYSMRVNGDFIEVDCCQKNKVGHIVCGDTFMSQKFKEEGRVISVLSDGLGSGIKASVLSTITSSMLLNFSLLNEDIMDSASSVLKTLPQDEIRKISYSTFCLCEIDCFGKVRIAEYETPSFYLLRNGEFVNIQKKKIPVEREDLDNTHLLISEFKMQKEDRIIFFSDGVSQSGMGNLNMPFGWEEGSKDYISMIVSKSPDISAKDLSRRIVIKAEQNDYSVLKDDTSCCVIYMRKPRNLLVCTGPPYDEKNDGYLSNYIRDFQGRKIVCGGTTAQIISRETGRSISTDISPSDRELPPISKMDGVDLITEGILTLSKVERILSEEEYESKNKDGPAEKLLRLLADSDKITFLVGTRINIAHQDPTLPIELEIRRNVVKKIKSLLESKWLKDVDISYI
ncbi:MAG: SpoIIE family protein phosphatase [Bacteroidales bacterium]|nr:SpoIIE family protein phosphatase [Bacteroidales bacterium]